MQTLRQEVQKFISACEGIQSLLAQGGRLTLDERKVIKYSAIDLLGKVEPEPLDSGAAYYDGPH